MRKEKTGKRMDEDFGKPPPTCNECGNSMNILRNEMVICHECLTNHSDEEFEELWEKTLEPHLKQVFYEHVVKPARALKNQQAN